MYRDPKFRVDAKYVWYNRGGLIVLMYFFNNIPFSFDEVFTTDKRDEYTRPELTPYDMETIKLADQQKRYEPEDLYRGVAYLIAEEAHPCFFDVPIENAEILPDDICGNGEDVIDYF